jgi:hypothetical protein
MDVHVAIAEVLAVERMMAINLDERYSQSKRSAVRVVDNLTCSIADKFEQEDGGFDRSEFYAIADYAHVAG